jgi:hypothetical protein
MLGGGYGDPTPKGNTNTNTNGTKKGQAESPQAMSFKPWIPAFAGMTARSWFVRFVGWGERSEPQQVLVFALSSELAEHRLLQPPPAMTTQIYFSNARYCTATT